MGSFASSIHVRSNDTAAVLAALDACLRAEGYVRQADAPTRPTPPARGVYVAHAVEGWVGVLDSDIGESGGLAGSVAGELDTPVLVVLVDDSNSWHYQLFVGDDMDEFASVERDDEEVGSAGDVALGRQLMELIRLGDPRAMERLMGERKRQIHADLEAKMPPDILEIHRRMQQNQVTIEERRRYGSWAQSQTPWMMARMPALPKPPPGPGLLGRLLPAEGPKADGQRAPRGSQHLEYLRPLLREGVTDDQALDAFARQSAFAEEDLAVFLPLLGIPALWAHLGYDYLPEMSASRLQEAGIILAEHRLYGPSEGSGR